MPASEKTALEAVMEADKERIKLEQLAEELVSRHDEESQDYLMEVTFFCFNLNFSAFLLCWLYAGG
jgi:hypothetical protein